MSLCKDKDVGDVVDKCIMYSRKGIWELSK